MLPIIREVKENLVAEEGGEREPTFAKSFSKIRLEKSCKLSGKALNAMVRSLYFILIYKHGKPLNNLSMMMIAFE